MGVRGRADACARGAAGGAVMLAVLALLNLFRASNRDNSNEGLADFVLSVALFVGVALRWH